MQQTLMYTVVLSIAMLAALAVALGMVGAVQFTSRRENGYMHLIFYAIIFMIVLGTLYSGRDLTAVALSFGEDVPPEAPRDPLVIWVQRLISMLLVTVAGERILTYWSRRTKTMVGQPALLVAFIVFWTCTVAAPALFGANPFVSHDYLYTLVIGIAAILVTASERDLAFRSARNALLILMAMSLLLIPFKQSLVLDYSYNQGLLPGVPRLAGVAVHAVSLGILAQLGLICLLAFPYERRWVNRLAWAVGLVVLFLAQSKTSWIAFMLCFVCMMAVRHTPTLWRRTNDPGRPHFGLVLIGLGMFAVLAVSVVLMFGDLGGRLDRFFNSSEGAQLASLTGRDKIWAIAYDEWQRNPVFGYGTTIWDEVFRKSIGMPNASHAHNQFMDTLSRSGTVGATALVIYALVLLTLSVRYAGVSRGLTLALFLSLVIRSISEVPLSLIGYGEELVSHVLLLMALSACASEVRMRQAQPRHTPARQSSRPPLRPVRNTVQGL